MGLYLLSKVVVCMIHVFGQFGFVTVQEISGLPELFILSIFGYRKKRASFALLSLTFLCQK